jgi:phosphoenolpyruvate-protein kinase (PTS system EI component)
LEIGADVKHIDIHVSLVGERLTPDVIGQFAGVGLIRGEFVQRRVQRSMLTPDVRETLRAYLSDIATVAGEREVWYRTMDLWTEEGNSLAGASYVGFERNPLVGVRGGRRAKQAPDEFKAECEVVAEVSAAHPNLRVQFPFVGDGTEFAWLADTARSHGLPGPFGSMVEIPSAALGVAEIVRAGATRLLVGLNDLSCLTCGAERSFDFDTKLHPALWRLIDLAVDAAHEAGVPIGVAGSLSPEVLERAAEHGLDFATVHYSQARTVLDLGDQPWPDEGLELDIKLTTRAAIDRFTRDIWLLSSEEGSGS